MKVGDELPPVAMTMDSARLVMYAGATWDWHALHHDTRYAESAGLDAPIVDGQMFGALAAEQTQQLLGPTAMITRMALKFRSMVLAGESVEVAGEIVSVEQNGSDLLVATEHNLRVEDRICATSSVVTKIQQ